MDSIDQLRVYVAAVEAVKQALDSLRATHRIYNANGADNILPYKAIQSIEELSYMLSEYAQEEAAYV